MEQNPEFDKYAKAKIEEPNLRLPKEMLKLNTDPSTGELCYFKIFEDDTKRAKHMSEAIAAGAEVDRKVYRIRNMELEKVTGVEFKYIHYIHKISKATIGLLVDSEADEHCHSFLDLLGTVEQVQMAEKLILDKILKTYQGKVFPVILMPPNLYGHEIRLHMDKLLCLLGQNARKALAIEMLSGAWLQFADEPPAGGPEDERVVNIYGPKANVFKAASLVHAHVYDDETFVAAEEELDKLYKELSFEEVLEGMKSRNPEMVEAATGSSSSGQTKQEKGQHVEAKDESKGKNKQEDVKEAVSGKPKGSGEDLD